MWFVTLVKFRRKLTKADSEAQDRRMAEAAKWGVKVHNAFWTLGQYDAVWIAEAPDEKTMMRVELSAGDIATTQTLVAVSRDEARKWLE